MSCNFTRHLASLRFLLQVTCYKRERGEENSRNREEREKKGGGREGERSREERRWYSIHTHIRHRAVGDDKGVYIASGSTHCIHHLQESIRGQREGGGRGEVGEKRTKAGRVMEKGGKEEGRGGKRRRGGEGGGRRRRGERVRREGGGGEGRGLEEREEEERGEGWKRGRRGW